MDRITFTAIRMSRTIMGKGISIRQAASASTITAINPAGFSFSRSFSGVHVLCISFLICHGMTDQEKIYKIFQGCSSKI
jgi:hypothetical protein